MTGSILLLDDKPEPTKPVIVQRLLPGPHNSQGVVSSWGYGRLDRAGHAIRFIVNHVAVGNNSLYNWFYGQELSTHYWVSKTGLIEQYVPNIGAAYGQGIVTAGSQFPPEYPGNGPAYNQMALSIEREGYPTEEPTTAQWDAIVRLNRYLATTYQVPVDTDHIVGHYRTDHISREHCPSSPSLNASAYMTKLVEAIKGT